MSEYKDIGKVAVLDTKCKQAMSWVGCVYSAYFYSY